MRGEGCRDPPSRQLARRAAARQSPNSGSTFIVLTNALLLQASQSSPGSRTIHDLPAAVSGLFLYGVAGQARDPLGRRFDRKRLRFHRLRRRSPLRTDTETTCGQTHQRCSRPLGETAQRANHLRIAAPSVESADRAGRARDAALIPSLLAIFRLMDCASKLEMGGRILRRP
jgi:hypothetical protein